MEARKFIPHYSVNDWKHWEGKWELIDGMPVSMSPTPSPIHQLVAANLTALFYNALQNCDKCKVYGPLDWVVDDDNVFEPDLLIVCEEPGTWEDGWLKKPPSLVAEILSPSTRKKDLTVKMNAYADSGIQYYLIVDPDNRTLLVHQIDSGAYAELYQGDGITLPFTFGPCFIEADLSKAWLKI